MLGYILGSFVTFYLGDTTGRRTSFIIFLSVSTVCLALFTFSINIYYIYAFTIIGNICNSMNNNIATAYLFENLSESRRSIFSSILLSSFSISPILFGCAHLLIDCSWRYLIAGIGVLNFFVLCLFIFFIIESPSTFIVNKDKEGYYKALEAIAKFNGRLEKFETEKEGAEVLIEEKETKIVECEIGKLFIFKSLRTSFLVLNVLSFILDFNYYGSTFYVRNLNGSLYFNAFVMSTMEGIGYYSDFIMSEIFNLNRKTVICIGNSSLIIVYLVNYLFPFKYSINLCTFGTKFFCSLLFNILYVTSSEGCPSSLRAVGLAFVFNFGKFGGIFSGYLIEKIGEMTFIFYLIGALISIFSTWFLKESKNIPMKDFAEEEESETDQLT